MNKLRQSKVKGGSFFPLNSGRTLRISKFKEFSKMTCSLTPFQKTLTLWRFVICLEIVDVSIMRCKQSDSGQHTDLVSFLGPFLTRVC